MSDEVARREEHPEDVLEGYAAREAEGGEGRKDGAPGGALRPSGEDLDLTCDDYLQGALRLWQPIRGLRANVDTVLLGAFARARRRDRVLDLGCASGAVALHLAWRFLHISALGVDIQEHLVTLAERNARENGLEDRVSFVAGDLRRPEDFCAPESFDVVVANPPYGDGALSRPSPSLSAAVARHDLCCSLAQMARAAAFALRSGGHLYTVFRAGRISALLAALQHCRLEPKRMVPVYPKTGRDASVILVGAVKGAHPGARLEAPILIQGDDGHFTDPLCRAYTREGFPCR